MIFCFTADLSWLLDSSVLQRQTEVTAYLKSKQLLLIAFANDVMQRKTTVTAYLKSKQLLLFVFANAVYKDKQQ